MNKSVMKCCICNNKNIGEFITINDKKYHLCCIEQLQQENEKNKHYKTLYQSLKKQKEELRSWLKEGFSYDKGVVDENFIEAIENVLEKMEELEGVSNE